MSRSASRSAPTFPSAAAIAGSRSIRPRAQPASRSRRPLGQNEVEPQQTGITLTTDDIDATHAELKRLDVDVDAEVSRMGDPVPPMFWFRDPTGHTLMVVEQPS